MNKTVSATHARKNFFQLLKLAAKPGSSITITLEGTGPIVMMSQEEFEGWQETLDIMSDPELMSDIHEGTKEKGGVEWSALKRKLKL
jgi:prevent-host-death family protein